MDLNTADLMTLQAALDVYADWLEDPENIEGLGEELADAYSYRTRQLAIKIVELRNAADTEPWS